MQLQIHKFIIHLLIVLTLIFRVFKRFHFA